MTSTEMHRRIRELRQEVEQSFPGYASVLMVVEHAARQPEDLDSLAATCNAWLNAYAIPRARQRLRRQIDETAALVGQAADPTAHEKAPG